MTEQQDYHFESTSPTDRLVQMFVEMNVGIVLGVIEVIAFSAPLIVFLWKVPPQRGAAGLALLVCLFTGLTVGAHRIGTHRHAVHDVSVWPDYRDVRGFLGGWVESIRSDTVPRLLVVYWGMPLLALGLSRALLHVDVSDVIAMTPLMQFIIVVGVPAWSVDWVYRKLAGERVER